MFVAPALVLLGVLTGHPMDLVFAPLEVAAVAAEVATDVTGPALLETAYELGRIAILAAVERAGIAAADVDMYLRKPEARAVGATCGGIRVWSLYVPNGGVCPAGKSRGGGGAQR